MYSKEFKKKLKIKKLKKKKEAILTEIRNKYLSFTSSQLT
jgi:hypothetical protein